jgi:hypothetical protein
VCASMSPRQTASRSQQRSVHPMDRIDREYRLSRFRPQRWEANRALGMIPISRLSGSSPLHSNVLVRFARTLRRTSAGQSATFRIEVCNIPCSVERLRDEPKPRSIIQGCCKPAPSFAMSELGQSRRFRDVRSMSGLPQTADISGPGRHFAFVPTADMQHASQRVESTVIWRRGAMGAYGLEPITWDDLYLQWQWLA